MNQEPTEGREGREEGGRDAGVVGALSRGASRIAHGLPLRASRSRGSPAVDSANPLAAFTRYNRAYFQRWLLIGALIGVVAGLGAIVFSAAIAFMTHILLGGIAGFTPPSPAGEGKTSITPIGRRWLIPLVTTLGGLMTGLIVFTLAPEAEGHGTDAAIEAFHEKGGRIRTRIPLIKLVASAVTIGSGGSAGREGPTAQISAGFGSLLGDLLHLDDHDRRIAVAAGIGSGIGAIFKAPFGGALLAAEILYKRDFESDALFPSFVASVVGFTIYGAWAGWTPIFGAGGHFGFTNPASLSGYLVLGVCAGAVGLLYPKTLYGIRDLFHKMRVPNHIKPAIGGLLVGLIGLVIPQTLGMGYGYVQFGINSDYLHVTAWLMAALIFVKIFATSLTIGSGGSGGVFGPGMVIGGFLGSALWAGLHSVAPGLVAGTNAGAFVVVGMGAFFGGIAKAPLAVILMVAEMTGEFSLIAPAMLATMVAYLITGDTSIYENQVPTRLDSPAHKDDFALPLLQSVQTRDAMVSGVSGALVTATPDTPVAEVRRRLKESRGRSVPIISDGRLVGVVTAADLARVTSGASHSLLARQIMSRDVAHVYPDDTLYATWLRMSRRSLRQIAVVSRDDSSRLLGMVTTDGIARLLRLSTRQAEQLAATAGASATETAGARPSQHNGEGDERARSDGTEAALAEAAPGDGDPLAHLRVADAMLTTPRLGHENDSVSLAQALLEERGNALMVVDTQGMLVGIVSRSDLRAHSEREGERPLTLADVAVRNVVTADANETLRAAARRMSRLGLRQLPVISDQAPSPPLGLLRRSDIFAAYEQALEQPVSSGG